MPTQHVSEDQTPDCPPEYEIRPQGSLFAALARIPGGALRKTRREAAAAAWSHRDAVESAVLGKRPSIHAMANALQSGLIAADAALVALSACTRTPTIEAVEALKTFRARVDALRNGGAR